MTAFDDEFASAALPDLFAQFGETVVYADPAYDPVTLTAMVGPVSAMSLEGADGGLDRRVVREMTISRDPDGEFGGIASPRDSRRDTRITIAGEEWGFDDDLIARQTENTTTLRLVQVPALEKSRPGYRR